MSNNLFSKVDGKSIVISDFQIEKQDEKLRIKMTCVSEDQNAYFIVFENGEFKEIAGDIIHALNKNIVRLDENSKHDLENRKNILLLGDGYADLKMISENDKKNAITVGFLDEKVSENLELYNKGFDIVLTDLSSFKDVNNILKIY